MSLRIRLVREQDAGAILEIYAPLVRKTAISFASTPPSIHEVRERIRDTLRSKPWLVLTDGQALLGYTSASPYRPRPAYKWCVETTIYIASGYRGSGMGRALYTSLVSILRLQGFYNACAVITLPNAASVALHESMGFEPVGVYKAMGYKLGAWHDVGWWRLSLQADLASPPAPPLTLGEAVKSDDFEAALLSGLHTLQAFPRPENPTLESAKEHESDRETDTP
jgi:L-amino acid N-acyltransferase YncA